MKNLLNYLTELIGETIKTYKPVSGGDISNAFFIETKLNRYFLKVNSQKEAYSMFLAEKQGLETIEYTQTIATPKVYHCGQHKGYSFLLMEFVESRTPTSEDFKSLANQLAGLHKISTSEFGWEQNNFIGSLAQSNKQHKNWTAFYLEERIFPQLQLAQIKNLLSLNDLPNKQKMYTFCEEFFEDIKPSLVHGDLWSGNFLIALDGTPYLIDPAVYYGHYEIDIAMSKLFGGFHDSFYRTYQEHFPFSEHTRTRIDLYQLYYLLVHLNLFGSSYFRNVQRILLKYF